MKYMQAKVKGAGLNVWFDLYPVTKMVGNAQQHLKFCRQSMPGRALRIVEILAEVDGGDADAISPDLDKTISDFIADKPKDIMR